MKIVKRIVLGLVVVLLVVAFGGYAVLYHVAHRGIPDYDGRVALAGLQGEVEVLRDAFAVPHIYAQSETDLYRAVGWCMAQDRLFQMDLIRRVTMGRLSEVIGEKTLEVDLLMRALDMTGKSRRLLAAIDTDQKAAVNAFADGVNQYIETHRDRLPPEFTILGYTPEPWKPIHSFNVIGYMAFDLSTGWRTEILFHQIMEKLGQAMVDDILPDIGASRVIYSNMDLKTPLAGLGDVLPDAADVLADLGLTVFSGSNNWAVTGAKSARSGPILANDMHLGLHAPGIWYPMHQELRGKFSVTGVVVPGQPFVTAGHNEHMAWGFTNVMNDDMDFYLEQTDPNHPDQYRFNGAWRPMTVRTEEIGIKGKAPVRRKLRFTHRGPVISALENLDGPVVSAAWTGNADSNEVRSLYLLARARDWQDFRNAMTSFRSVSQNTVYADTGGNIGLYCCAGIPIREKGDGVAIFPGWTDDYDWKGFVPFEQQPHSYNPQRDFVASANNRTAGDDYPHYISRWFVADHRYRRIEEMLTEKTALSVDDIKRMHGDWKSKLVEDMRADLLASLGRADGLDADQQSGRQRLAAWDGVVAPQSSAAAIFEVFYLKLLTRVFADELGPDLFQRFLDRGYVMDLAMARLWKNPASAWYDDVATAGVRETRDDVVRKSFADAVQWLKQELGEEMGAWRWDRLHQLTLNHPLGSVSILDRLFDLNRGPYPAGGSFHTVSPYKYKYTDPFKVHHGASHRHIYTPDDWDASQTVIPTGVCGVPASPHYCDQTGLYMANRYHADPFSRAAVEAQRRYRMTLTPQAR